jgi:hypothetical protein
MTESYHANSTGSANCDDEGAAAALGIAEWLCLAAAPTFAIMALMTGVLGGSQTDMLCAGGPGFPLTGMVPMYVLMSAFHLAPWLKLISRRPSPRAVGHLRPDCSDYCGRDRANGGPTSGHLGGPHAPGPA